MDVIIKMTQAEPKQTFQHQGKRGEKKNTKRHPANLLMSHSYVSTKQNKHLLGYKACTYSDDRSTHSGRSYTWRPEHRPKSSFPGKQRRVWGPEVSHRKVPF